MYSYFKFAAIPRRVRKLEQKGKKMRKTNRSTLPKLIELEERTAVDWLARGTIAETSRGEENTYYCDEFENQFYCKNYPR